MTQVKISDLSVGDWVSDKNGIIAQIRGMECWSDGYAINVQTKAGTITNLTEAGVCPIPITPEILKKNGAKKTEFVKDSGYEFYQCDDVYALRVEGSKWWTIIVRNECREVVNCYVQHIHQLQRAMKLAGREKEIEL